MSDPLYDLPSERIKLTYQSDLSDNDKAIELPFKLLVLGNFQGKDGDESVSDRPSVSIDKNNFPIVMRSANVNLTTNIDNRLIDAKRNYGASMPINIDFKSLRDFHPDAFIKQIPDLDKLVKFRDLLTKTKTHPKQINKTIEEIKNLLLTS